MSIKKVNEPNTYNDLAKLTNINNHANNMHGSLIL